MELLKVENLSVEIGRQKDKVKPVRDVSFSLHKGEVLAIVGESGCGKSTVVRSLMGLLDPVSSKREGGQAIYLGKDLFQMKEKELCRIRGKEISMIFQNPLSALDPVYTIGDQIVEIIRIHEKISKKEAYEKAVFLLKQVKIPSPEVRIQQYPHELSGGMQQRVMIAIALACNPKVLIADEPTTALDVTIQDQILRQLKELEKEYGTSIIFITHDLGVVAKVADYVDVMYAGKIVETGTIDEIFYDPRHPYTWGLLSAMPDLDTADERLYTIPGSPPNLLHEKAGDAFAPRNKYALKIDDEIDPPMFKISDTHFAATWLLDPRAPKVEMPPELKERVARMRAEAKKIEEAE